jgi:hypothetical protein
MNKPSISDVLTKLEAVTQRIGTLDETVMQRIGTLDESVTQRITSLANTFVTRFDKVERTLDEHSFALLELSTITAQHTMLHREHSAALGRIETRQRSDTRALDDHEIRIKGLEKRPHPPASAR